jgi:RNA polymerase sigma-70 factor (ECF subfamily)
MTEIEEAVRRFLDGEQEAFSLIVRRYEKRVYNLAWRMLGNREDAQDVVQETFLSAFKSLRGLRDPASFSTWLYRIALNHCRALRRTRSSDLSIRDSISGQAGEEDGQSSGLYVVRQRGEEKLESRDIIRKALAGLSEDHRTAIILKEYLGLSLEELASVMDCPLSTAKSRLYHGLRGVQQNLKRMGVKFVDKVAER